MQNESFSTHDGPETAPADMETAKQKFERERLTRRQALKRFGMTSAMTAFALFSVDDLARMVGAAMERQAKNSKIAEQVAKEFQSAGIALATTPYTYYTCALEGCKNPDECTANSFIMCAPCNGNAAHPCVVEAFNCTAPYYGGQPSCQDCCNTMLLNCQKANYGGCDTLNTDCVKRCGAT